MTDLPRHSFPRAEAARRWFLHQAGAGIKGGTIVGATDELGLRAIDNPIHVHDLHATILYALGIDHFRLTIPHHGRNERATVNAGKTISALFG